MAPKTKEELAQLRKDMMKRKPGTTTMQQPTKAEEEAKQKAANDPHAKLMARLATGKKHDVDKTEMKKLTNKNYELLPEVRKKREEERKKEEAR